MALFNYSLFSLVSVLLIIFCAFRLSAASFRVELAPSQVAALCKESINHTFCLDFLNSTAGIPAADLLGAGKITLKVGRDKALDARKCVKALLAQTTDPKLKESYKTCMENYGDATDAISAAKASLVAKDYATANIKISAAQTDADTCDDEVKGLPAAAELGERNRYLFNLLNIGLLITNKLGGFHE
ncbi:unnamed protein product [Linum tenue]|uniref:Pectinesterase inhibitor domain-containing protein n=1 Tax=Linum tenue TaxID=586396 RepID=A0AAV0KLN2_9ROSI|nr:unnamed protein product [Linum tenue]